MVAEFKSAPEKPNFSFVVDKIVKPLGIGLGKQKHYRTDTITAVHLTETFLHPFPYRSAVGRIAENSLARPVLLETVIGFRVILATLVIGLVCTRIKGKFELIVQFIE